MADLFSDVQVPAEFNSNCNADRFDVVLCTPSFLPEYNGMTFATLQHALILRDFGFRVGIMSFCAVLERDLVSVFLLEKGLGHIPVNLFGSGLISRPIVGDISDALARLVAVGARCVIVEGKYFWGYDLIPDIKRFGIGVALISHGSAPISFEWRLGWVAKFLIYKFYILFRERKILRSVDSAAVLSAHQDRDRFMDSVLFRRSELCPSVVANSSLEGAVALLRRKPGTVGRFRIAIVGAMCDLKNQLALFQVLRRVSCVEFVRLYYSKANAYSAAFIERSKGFDSVYFDHVVGLGRSEIVGSLGDIDIVLCLSKTEAQPLSIVDGIACGIPFLSTNVGCLASMQGGVVAKIGEMPEVLNRLAVDPIEYLTLSREALRYYSKVHAESVVAPSLIRLVQNSISQRKGG